MYKGRGLRVLCLELGVAYRGRLVCMELDDSGVFFKIRAFLRVRSSLIDQKTLVCVGPMKSLFLRLYREPWPRGGRMV